MACTETPPLSPLRLSTSIYSWDDAVTVTFDTGENRLVHVMTDGFYAVAVGKPGKSSTATALFVSLSAFGCADWVRDVRLAPSGKHMCIYGQPDGNACCLWINRLKQASYKTASAVMFRKGGADVELLHFNWMKSTAESYDDLVVVTTAGVEVFRIFYEPVSVKSVRWYAMNIRLAWISPHIVMVCLGAKTLQPLDLRLTRPWLPKFDLYVQTPIVVENVELVTLYGMTFCVHLDHYRQRLSLRNVSEPSRSAPEYDVVIDLSARLSRMQPFYVAVCDELLLVHAVKTGECKPVYWLYDIKSESPLWESDLPLLDSEGRETEEQEFAKMFGRHVVDTKQQLRSFEIDMVALRLHLRKKRPLHEVIEILSRRTDCRAGIMFELRDALTREDIDEWQRSCTSLTSAYRMAIEEVSAQQAAKPSSSRGTVSLAMLMTAAANLSILSEKDIAMNVFLPHLIEHYPEAVSEDGENVLLRPLEMSEAEKAGGLPIRPPFFVLAVTGYMRSLLNKNILPHRILQGFVFDVLIIFRQDHLLQQMLHYHVLLDSEDILSRLRQLALETKTPWIMQACQDMAQRLKEFHIVAEVLLGANLPFQALSFVMSRQLMDYPLRNIFAQFASADMFSVGLEVRNWLAVQEGKSGKLPNMDGCEQYREALGI